jgi:hypothetical protein
MIYTAPYVMLYMHANRLFWAPNGTHLTARCHFKGPKKVLISRPHQKHYVQGHINPRSIGSFMYELPGPIARLWGRVREHSAVNFSYRTAPTPYPPSAVNLNHKTD